MRTVIRSRGLTRKFASGSGQIVTALHELDLDLPNSALIVVRGPSGCGKSTLLNLVGALDQPTGGSLVVAGAELSGLHPDAAARFRRENLGFLFQDAGLIEPMTVYDNVVLPLVYRDVAVTARLTAVLTSLDRVGLADRAESQVSELSGGERLRVGLARALVSNPPLLICDEPTAALDEENSRVISAFLSARAADGQAVICSSHDPLLIARADVVVSLRHGRLDVAGQ